MSKITLIETLEWVPVSGSKLYQDAADGVFSTEKNKQGRKVVDVAALEGAYGKLRNPQEDDVESETDDHGHRRNPESSNGHPASSNGASPHLSESVQTGITGVHVGNSVDRASASEQTLIIGQCCHGDDEVEVPLGIM